MKSRQLYLALDWKHAGIPICVADSPSELARLRKTSLTSVSHTVKKARLNPNGHYRYVSVWTRWSDSDYYKYFGRTV